MKSIVVIAIVVAVSLIIGWLIVKKIKSTKKQMMKKALTSAKIIVADAIADQIRAKKSINVTPVCMKNKVDPEDYYGIEIIN